MSNPWIKFYPRDWRGDQALRAVSVAARGLWIECLCIMHEAKPYGHLLLNGEPVRDDALARMAGASLDETAALMVELEKAGVFSRSREGVIYSRRMTKDYGRAVKGQKAAKKRWSQDAENTQQSCRPNGSPNGRPITQKPEARSQKGEKRASAPIPLPSDQVREIFNRIWSRLPTQARRVGEPGGMMAFARVVTNGADPAEIERAVGPWLAASPDGIVERFDRWLSGDKWREWLPKAPAPQAESEVSFVLHFQRSGDWLGQGPPPTPEQCADLLARHGYGERKTG